MPILSDKESVTVRPIVSDHVSGKLQSSRDSLTHWALEVALISRIAERTEDIAVKDGGLVISRIDGMVERRGWK